MSLQIDKQIIHLLKYVFAIKALVVYYW